MLGIRNSELVPLCYYKQHEIERIIQLVILINYTKYSSYYLKQVHIYIYTFYYEKYYPNMSKGASPQQQDQKSLLEIIGEYWRLLANLGICYISFLTIE